jgi:hypothetical protein
MGSQILVFWLLAQMHLHHASVTSSTASIEQNLVTQVRSVPRDAINPSAVRSAPYPGQMSMFSVYAGASEEKLDTDVWVHCKTERSISNMDVRVPIFGVVQEDVVSAAGKILIPAGSKVFGQGYCESERARLLSRGHWTFYLSDHQIEIQGTLWDGTPLEGLAGEEITKGLDESRVKQAIYRDGVYIYVPSGTDFTLRLKSAISVEDLPSAFGK